MDVRNAMKIKRTIAATIHSRFKSIIFNTETGESKVSSAHMVRYDHPAYDPDADSDTIEATLLQSFVLCEGPERCLELLYQSCAAIMLGGQLAPSHVILDGSDDSAADFAHWVAMRLTGSKHINRFIVCDSIGGVGMQKLSGVNIFDSVVIPFYSSGAPVDITLSDNDISSCFNLLLGAAKMVILNGGVERISDWEDAHHKLLITQDPVGQFVKLRCATGCTSLFRTTLEELFYEIGRFFIENKINKMMVPSKKAIKRYFVSHGYRWDRVNRKQAICGIEILDNP